MSQSQTPRLRIDKSRTFSTIHGQRGPDDPHRLAKFMQDGIHFDAQGLHIESLLDDESRPLLERRLKRQVTAAPKKEAAASSDPEDDDASNPQDTSDVNLEAWLRGEAKYPWFSITKLVRERFKSNITKAPDMVDFLINEMKVIPLAEVAPELAALLKSKDD